MTPNLLQIFAKAPVSGEVKTRLAADIGDVDACEVYKQLLSNTLKNGVSKDWKTEIWCTPDDQHPFLKKLSEQYKVSQRIQYDGSLGQRMLSALQHGQIKAQKVVLIGSDCPVMSLDTIQAAFNALDTYDVVFSPAEDGGYVLVGCSRTSEEMFEEVEWSVAETLEQSMSALKRCGLSYQLLPVLWDVDTLIDLKRWQGVS